MIRIDTIWLATEPMNMRAGTNTAMARVIWVFGAAQPHCAYLLANRRAMRIKILVHDGLGIWLAARRLHQGKFIWPGTRHGPQMELSVEQLHALILGLPWHAYLKSYTAQAVRVWTAELNVPLLLVSQHD